jgi:NAD-dependent dihydropyrimidine dehydrogenase PreA subunit
VCSCTYIGATPYPQSGFDLNLSRVENGYIIEIGSEKGKELVARHETLFTRVPDEQLRARDNKRKEIIQKVDELNKDYTLSKKRPELLQIHRESDEWFEHVRTCVECGACLFACPTCHCFLLYDQEEQPGKFQRNKVWDACAFAGFTRMAGGSSPRVGLMERFRHRYLHKFEYFPKIWGFEACTGCGRCIEGCMGKIDMRKVFKALDTLPVGIK